MTEVQRALAYMDQTKKLLDEGVRLFPSIPRLSFNQKDYSAQSSIHARNSCGIYSQVLAKVIQKNGFPIRIAQIQGRDGIVKHVVVEAIINGNWALLDPKYNLVFKKSDGTLASFLEVSQNLDSFKNQTPPGYLEEYEYRGVRYTNWSKIQFVTPFLKKVCSFFVSDPNLSLRVYLINFYQTVSFLFLIYFIFILPLGFVIYCLGKRRSVKP